MRSLNFFCILFFLCTLNLVKAQSNADYVVTAKLDTLQGKITFLKTQEIHDKVLVKNSEGKKSYRAYQLRSVNYDNESYFPIKIANAYKLMRLEKDGYLSKYRFRGENSSDFGSIYLRKRDGEGAELPNPLFFKNSMKKFLKECPKIVARIDNGDYKVKSIDQLIEDYNSLCISNTIEEIREKYAENEDSKLFDLLKSQTTDKDLISIISDIQSKFIANEIIPSYLVEIFKSKSESLKGADKVFDLVDLHNAKFK